MRISFKYLSGLFIFFLFISCGKHTKIDSKIENNTWNQIKATDGSAPIARHEAAFVNVEDKFYLLGGRRIQAVSIFDTKTQTWSLGAKPPIELHHFQPIIYGSKIYIIGALTGGYPSETPVTNIYIYNTKLNTWEVGDEIPVDRRRGSTGNCVKNDVVYISCGISNGHIDGHKKWMDSYNLKTGVWKILPDAPRARDHFQAVEADGKIYVLAGRLSKAPKATFSETIGEVDVYDIKREKWITVKEHLPTQRAGNMALLYGKEILVVGGESLAHQNAHNEVEALNIDKHTWRSYPSLLQGRHGTGVVLYNDAMYIASGCGNRGGSPELITMEKF